ncbi:MAG: hypothetical protein V4564_07735 [Pseudomonadota bacterium]
MANWYVSSVDHAAIGQWAALTTLATGAIRRQLAAPAVNSERCFRVSAITTGITGASEPTWNLGNNATTTDSGVTWTECTGQEAHQRDNGATVVWTAPAPRVGCLMFSGKAIVAQGDFVYCSSDHAETQASTYNVVSASSAGGLPCYVMSVAKSGSVPPVAGNIAAGASVATTSTGVLGLCKNLYMEGFTLSAGSGSSAGYFSFFADNNQGQIYLKNCTTIINNTGATCYYLMNAVTGSVIFDNTTVQFGGTGHMIYAAQGVDFQWLNTPSAIAGSVFPTLLFNMASSQAITCRGVDLSALGSGKTIYTSASGPIMSRAVFENCKLNASVTTVATLTGATANRNVKVDFINCDSGATGYRNEWHRMGGDITTETTITRASGATDGVQAVSWKAVSGASSVMSPLLPLEFPPISQWNSLTGSSRTATIEIISSGTLNNDDIWVDLEYLGSSGSPLGSGVNSTIATRLTANAACPTSSMTWNSSPSTPQKQYLQVTFTPQMAGLVVARVKLAKVSATVYVDPLITIA